jgi:hypothetical protein
LARNHDEQNDINFSREAKHGPKWRRKLARYEKIVLKSKPRRDGHGYHCSKLGWIKTLIFLSAITIMSEIKLQI